MCPMVVGLLEVCSLPSLVPLWWFGSFLMGTGAIWISFGTGNGAISKGALLPSGGMGFSKR